MVNVLEGLWSRVGLGWEVERERMESKINDKHPAS